MFSIEAIKVIALLCTLNSNTDIGLVEREQLKCQQYYVQCIFDLETGIKSQLKNLKPLSQCILEKK